MKKKYILLSGLFTLLVIVLFLFKLMLPAPVTLNYSDKSKFEEIVKVRPHDNFFYDLYSSSVSLKVRGVIQERKFMSILDESKAKAYKETFKNLSSISSEDHTQFISWFTKNKFKKLIPIFSSWFPIKNENPIDGIFCNDSTRIVRYAFLLKGIQTRQVIVEGVDGEGNWSHVFLEAWSNEKSKWLYVDPHYGVSSEKFSFLELHNAFNSSGQKSPHSFFKSKGLIKQDINPLHKIPFTELFSLDHQIIKTQLARFEVNFKK